MSEDPRQAVQYRERGKAAVRSLFLAELEDLRHKRTVALREAEEQLDCLARLLPNALEAGISVSEIARAADVSRPTLYQLRGRYSKRAGDLRLTVISVVASRGDMYREQIVEAIGADKAAILDMGRRALALRDAPRAAVLERHAFVLLAAREDGVRTADNGLLRAVPLLRDTPPQPGCLAR